MTHGPPASGRSSAGPPASSQSTAGPPASSRADRPQASSRANRHKGWYTHKYIPHFDLPGIIQGITFRLADSLPRHVVETMSEESKHETDEEKRARVEQYLNSGYGACYLKDERIGRLVEDALLHFHGQRYQLIAWVIMPNHVHVLVELFEGCPMGEVIHSWKSFTAGEANKLLGRVGSFWFPDYYDRYIRDERHLAQAIAYIHQNPVRAGLVERAEDWPFSSARWVVEADGDGEED